MQLIISPRATQDIRDILQYTLEQWGEDQQIKYRGILTQALAHLQNNPHLGQLKEDIYRGLRVYRVEKHNIFYIVSKDTLRVARILHVRMDARRHL
jgi:toxin ParE1/3/4